MYIYRFYNKEKQIIYIGKTNNLSKRLDNHFGNYDRTLDKQKWRLKVKFYDYAKLPNAALTEIYEVYLINKIKPIYNKKNKEKGIVPIVLPELNFKKIELIKNKVKNFDNFKEKIKNRINKKSDINTQTARLIDLNFSNRYIKKGLALSEKINSTYSNRDKAIFETFYFVGVKISELTNITTDDLDFKKQTIQIENREYTIPDFLLNKYKKLIKSADKYVFKSNQGNIISHRTIQKMLKKYFNTTSREIRKKFKEEIKKEDDLYNVLGLKGWKYESINRNKLKNYAN